MVLDWTPEALLTILVTTTIREEKNVKTVIDCKETIKYDACHRDESFVVMFFKTPPSILVAGPSGSGKTWFVSHLLKNTPQYFKGLPLKHTLSLWCVAKEV